MATLTMAGWMRTEEHHSKISNKVMIVTKGTIARSKNSENGKNRENSEDGKQWPLFVPKT